ncbi:hypothetical protein HRUBRA_00705 [Pseudohaliea rubra DSM 19751]|uniref:Uncharacterized protein n=1 Tax=Pseudohaliea rubra DSM 19751 TaxID=1265313 RepID=A0A095VTJ6_9GAMM|nr:hypothetical protein HRUBRA_00705 [Pseudohaliea rubra DSM 19751]
MNRPAAPKSADRPLLAATAFADAALFAAGAGRHGSSHEID